MGVYVCVCALSKINTQSGISTLFEIQLFLFLCTFEIQGNRFVFNDASSLNALQFSDFKIRITIEIIKESSIFLFIL